MDNKETILNELFEKTSVYSQLAFGLSDYLTDHPELSGMEYISSKKIVDLLEFEGVEVTYPYGGLATAFKAKILNHPAPKLKAAILAEYDALPELGHACGHSASGAISILSSLAFNKIVHKLPISIDLIGTPNEEVEGGKAILVENQTFEDYDVAIMIHMDNRNRASVKLLAVKDIEVTFKGKTSHASASPWEGKNALNGLQLFFHAIDMLRQHVKTDVRIHGIIKEGGTAANIVPDLAKAHFFVRSAQVVYLDEVMEMVKDCARGAAIATQTEVEWKHLYAAYSELTPSKTANELIEKIYSGFDLELADFSTEAFGSSDIGNVSTQCPAFHPTIAITDSSITLHTAEFANALKSAKTYDAIHTGANIICQFLVELACNNDLLTQIKEEHSSYFR